MPEILRKGKNEGNARSTDIRCGTIMKQTMYIPSMHVMFNQSRYLVVYIYTVTLRKKY